MTIQKNFISLKTNKRNQFLRFILSVFFLLQTLHCASSVRKEAEPAHTETAKTEEKEKTLLRHQLNLPLTRKRINLKTRKELPVFLTERLFRKMSLSQLLISRRKNQNQD